MTLDHPIAELAAHIRRGEISPVDLARTALDRIDADRALNAYVTVIPDEALAAARVAERELRSGQDRGPLHGLPIALKDNIDTAGVRTTGGTAAFLDRVPVRDADCWARLRRAGAVLVGKTGLHELAYRAPHPAFGPTHNPFDASRSPGGSSSGSAVAVAAGHVVAALGTDTGGSVRQPAAFCGVVGIKPGRAAIPRDGVIPLARSLDAVGVLARDPDDAALVLRAIAPDIAVGPSAVRIGVAADDDAAACVRAAVRTSAALLAETGRHVAARTLPPAERLRALHRRILAFEAYAEHSRVLDRSGPLFRDAVRAGAGITVAEHRAALAERDALRAEDLLGDADILLLPTTPDVAPPLDTLTGRSAGDADLNRWTFLASLFDLPAVSVPAGEHDGLPVAVQLIGRRGSEATLLDLARAIFVPMRRAAATAVR